MFDAAAIARATSGRLVLDGPVGPVVTDSRAALEGAWFVALVGPRFDGHDFLDAARAARCAGVVVERLPSGWDRGAVVVPDTLRALQDLGAGARDLVRGPVVGVTGSAGKTTTRALAALALGPLGPVHQTVGNLNNHIGVPLTLLACPPAAAAAVVEMGTSSPGEIEVLARICRPEVRVIVNVGPAHLQELGGLDGVALEKGALFRSARPGDALCVNVDDPRVAALPRPAGTRVVRWGRAASADVRLVADTLDPERLTTRLVVRVDGATFEGEVPAPGAHVAADATAAIAVAWAVGVAPGAALSALAAYVPVGARLRRVDLGGVVILDDAYNANPTSVAAAIDLLRVLPGRRVVVLGDMLELGLDEAALHAEAVAGALGAGLDRVLLVGERMARAARGTPAWVGSAEDAAAELASWLRPGDRVLVKGSRGMRMERVLTALGDAWAKDGR